MSSGEVYFDSVLALASQRGLVVIDTGVAPSLTTTYRAKIEEAFGRKDFTYVINTHFHFDHSDGNMIFPEATVIASEAARQKMLEWSQTRDAFVTTQRGRVENWQRLATAAPADSEQRRRAEDLVFLYGRMANDLSQGFTLALPSVTFTDRLTLYLGDMTVRLVTYGPGNHSGDDIIVHVPELGIVAVGDLFAPRYVQILFGIGPDVDVAHKIAVLDEVLAEENSVREVVNGHGDRMTRAEFAARRDYLKAVWRAAQAEMQTGGTLSGLRARLPLDGELSFLKNLGIPADQLAREHERGVALAWLAANGGEDAAQVIDATIGRDGVEAAKAAFQRMLPLRDNRYLIDENAINALGYRLLGAGRNDAAVAVFEMNVAAFPNSWNVHDSLGEGLAALGQRERAIASYKRSLELNPDNASGKTQLERLEQPR